MIYFTSDLHFNHDKSFIYEPRGFNSINEMNETLIKNWNETITDDNDEIYVLGDFFLGTDFDYIQKTIHKLKGKIYLIRGNHDTPAKIVNYMTNNKIFLIADAKLLLYKKRNFFLCHYPTLTASFEQEPKKVVINLFGHTHSKEKFYENNPYMYNVSVDANNNRPVSIEKIIQEIDKKISEVLHN